LRCGCISHVYKCENVSYIQITQLFRNCQMPQASVIAMAQKMAR
jgi:hypothetical protein